jgi:hypothetical protein
MSPDSSRWALQRYKPAWPEGNRGEPGQDRTLASPCSRLSEGRYDTGRATPYIFSTRSSIALPTAWVRFCTFNLRRIFWTWFFTVSGLISRITPIS